MSKTTKTIVAAIAAIFLLFLAGCGSSSEGDTKSSASTESDWASGTKSEEPGSDDGFGTYRVEDPASGAVITVEIDKGLDYSDDTVTAVDEFVNGFAITPKMMDAGWAKATIDNTDGHAPIYPAVLMHIITGDGEKVEAAMNPVETVEMEVYEQFDDMGNDKLMDALEMLPGINENDPGIYPGTKETVPMMIMGDVESVKSIWMTDIEMVRE